MTEQTQEKCASSTGQQAAKTSESEADAGTTVRGHQQAGNPYTGLWQCEHGHAQQFRLPVSEMRRLDAPAVFRARLGKTEKEAERQRLDAQWSAERATVRQRRSVLGHSLKERLAARKEQQGGSHNHDKDVTSLALDGNLIGMAAVPQSDIDALDEDERRELAEWLRLDKRVAECVLWAS